MKIIKKISEIKKIRNHIDNVVFIPTMGNLHKGHISLIKKAKKYSKNIIVSIFINPLQFNSKEDFIKYPKTINEDILKLKKEDIKILFLPNTKTIYPQPQNYFITPPDIKDQLCGKYRPDHFMGVSTIIVKLFNIIKPNIAIFGKKDYQQYIIVKNMVKELDFDIKIIGVNTIRDKNGLALSSRNSRFNETQKKLAINLYLTLKNIKNYILLNGLNDINIFIKNQIKNLQNYNFKVDYIELRQLNNLQKINENTKQLIILGAVNIDNIRIIDNIPVIMN